MLRLEIIDSNGRPLTIDATRVVVRDGPTDTPIAVAVEYAPQMYLASAAGDPGFAKLLQGLRIDDTVIVSHRGPRDIPRLEL